MLVNLKQLFNFKKESTLHKNILLIGMPCWSVEYPFHSLAQVSGIIKFAGWNCTIADLNAKIFNAVIEEDKKYWTEEYVTLWAGNDIPSYIFKKYNSQIKNFLKDEMINADFDFVAFTLNMFTRFMSLKAAKYIKSLKRNVPVMFGGVDCFPLEYGEKFFERTNGFVPDIMLQGEAEISLPEFLKEYEKNKNYKTTVKGFLYKEKSQIVNTGEPELPNLSDNNVIADFSQFDFTAYGDPGSFPSFLSRGCINRCAFCSESPNFKRYRIRKAEDVIKEIKITLEKAKHHNPCPTIHFSDSLLNGNIKELDKLCDLILENRLKFNWGGQIYFRKEMTRDFLEKLRKSGCVAFFWGFESGSQTIVNAMRKRYDVDIAKRIVHDCCDLGITNYLPIIVGFPGETPLDFIRTMIFVIEFMGKNCVFFGPTPCLVRPNSPLHSKFKDFGLANNHYTDWYTEDNKNNVSVRLLRKFILGNVIRNETMDLDNIVQLDDIQNVDFNSYPVASELSSVLYELHAITDSEDSLKDFFVNFNGNVFRKISKDELAYWSHEKMTSDSGIENWFIKDKNEKEVKSKIISYIFDSIKMLKLKVTSPA